MEADLTIASASNSVLKSVRAALAGKDQERMVLEGDRLIADALGAGISVETILVADDRENLAASWEAEGLPVRRVLADLLARTSGLKTSPGSIALAPRPTSTSTEALSLSANALVLVAAGISDPGNLGALARSAEAAGAEALIVLAGSANPWSSKALRGSMGSLLRLPVLTSNNAAELAAALAARGLRQITAGTRGGKAFSDFDWSGPLALWMASEVGDLPNATTAFESVTIPMAGKVESLNVGVAGALLLFAAERWRGAAQ